MAKYQKTPVTVDAYKITAVEPADSNGNVAVSATDEGFAGSIPYSFPSATIEGFQPGDYVIEDQLGETTLMTAADFNATYHAV